MVEPSEPAAQTDDEKAPCPVCGEPISPKALKCIHCDSYLDWRRFLIVGNTALALVIALVSVATTAVTVYRTTDAKPDSTLEFRYLGVIGDKPTFLATNPGTLTAVVGRSTLDVGPTANQVFVPLAVDQADAHILLVEAGKVRQFALVPTGYPRSRNGRASQAELDQHSYTINIQQFKHDKENPVSLFRTDCTELAPVIANAQSLPN